MSPEDHEANRQTARQMELQQPEWMVVWGVYTKQYVAFPLFCAPARTILTASYPPALVQRMQTAERRFRRKRR